jgi:hypothetical protein
MPLTGDRSLHFADLADRNAVVFNASHVGIREDAAVDEQRQDSTPFRLGIFRKP